jgi:hypothetical protein
LRFEASLGKQFLRSYLKKTHHKKRAGGVAQAVGPEFKPRHCKEEKKRKKKKEAENKDSQPLAVGCAQGVADDMLSPRIMEDFKAQKRGKEHSKEEKQDEQKARGVTY